MRRFISSRSALASGRIGRHFDLIANNLEPRNDAAAARSHANAHLESHDSSHYVQLFARASERPSRSNANGSRWRRFDAAAKKRCERLGRQLAGSSEYGRQENGRMSAISWRRFVSGAFLCRRATLAKRVCRLFMGGDQCHNNGGRVFVKKQSISIIIEATSNLAVAR